MRRLIATVGITALVMLLAGPAQAQSAKDHYMQGVALFEAGNYKAALAEFLESYEAKPNWKLFHTIAVCYFNMNRFVDAKEALDSYLEDGGDDIPSEKKVESEEMLAQIAKLTASVKVEVNVDGATIWIDDEKMGETPMTKPLVLDSGVYELEITKSGYVKYKRDLKLAGGDKKEYVIALESKDGGDSTPPDDKGDKGDKGGKGGKGDKGDKGDKKPPKIKKPKTKDEKAAIGLLAGTIATGALALGGWGVVAGAGVSVSKTKEKFDGCDSPSCEAWYKNEGDKMKTVTNAFVGVASALTAASVGLGVGYAIKKKKMKEKPAEKPKAGFITVTPYVTDDMVYVGVGGTF